MEVINMNPLLNFSQNIKLSLSSMEHTVIQEDSRSVDYTASSKSPLSSVEYSVNRSCANCNKQSCTER